MGEVKFAGEKWRIGGGPYVLSDTDRKGHLLGEMDVQHYGGYLVAESIFVEDHLHLIAAAPELYQELAQLVTQGILFGPERRRVLRLLAKARGETGDE